MSGVSNADRVNIYSQWVDALALQQPDVEWPRVVDQREAALRRDQFGDRRQMLAGAGGREHERWGADAERRDLCRQRRAVVDHVMRAERGHPVAGFGARGGGDDHEVGQLPRKLDRDRPDAARAADDQDRRRAARDRPPYVEPVEQGLPRGRSGQRQRGGLGPVERRWLRTDDALVDQMKFGIGAGSAERAGVEDGVAGFEARGIGTGCDDRSGGVLAQDPPVAIERTRRFADLGVDRVHRNRADRDEQVATRRQRRGDLDILERRWILDRRG